MTENGETRPAKLPLFATVRAAYAVTWANLRSLGTIAMVWGPLVFVVMFAIEWLVWPTMQGTPSGRSLLLGLGIPLLASVLIGTTAAVAWHRHILLGEAVATDHIARYDGRVWRYVAWVLAMTVILVLPILAPIGWIASFEPDVLATSPTIDPSKATEEPADAGDATGYREAIMMIAAGSAILLPFSYPAMRLLPILPAVALGERIGAGAIWRATRGNFWRLLLGTLVTMGSAISLAIAIPITLAGVPSDSQSRLASSLWSAFYEVIGLVAGLVFVTFMSLAYRHFFPTGMAGGHTPRAD